MADRSTAYLFGQIFAVIDEHVKDDPTRSMLALKFWQLKNEGDYDFSDYQMSADKVLANLGLARQGIDPDYPDDGVVMLYGPVAK